MDLTFLKVFILATDGEVRSSSLLGFLKSNSINHEIIQGINSKYFSKDNFFSSDLAFEKEAFFMSTGEICCAIGHADIYSKIYLIDSKLFKYFLILEDDVEINKNMFLLFLKRVNLEIFQKFPKPKVLSLFSTSYIIAPMRNDLFSLVKPFNIYQCKIPPSSTVAYFINDNFVNLISNQIKPIQSIADWPFLIKKYVEFYLETSNLIKPDLFESLIARRSQNIYSLFTFKQFSKRIKSKNYLMKPNKKSFFYIKIDLIKIFYYFKHRIGSKKFEQKGYW